MGQSLWCGMGLRVEKQGWLGGGERGSGSWLDCILHGSEFWAPGQGAWDQHMEGLMVRALIHPSRQQLKMQQWLQAWLATLVS